MIERGGPHGVERPAAVPPQVPCDLPLPGAEPSAQLGAGHVRTRGRQKPVPSSWTMSSAAARPVLSVMLIVSDADAAVRWYTTALGAAQLWDLGGVAGLDLGGAPFFVHEAVPGKNQEPSPTAVGLTTTRIEVFIDAPDDLIERAAQAGATDVEPVSEHDAPWGRTVREGLPIHLVIVGQWATGPHCNGFPGRRRRQPASPPRSPLR